MKEDIDYRIKIDIPNVVELVSETFDGVLDHMFPGMLVFGGALRDVVAGFGLHHDLDIAASDSEGKKFIQYLETSSKWIEEGIVGQYQRQAKIMEDRVSNIVSPHSMENGMLDLNRGFPYTIKPKFSNYGNIQGVKTFINSFGRKLQIIITKSNPFTLEEQSPVSIVRTVDFICCGIMMDTNGNVYEIVEGAENDCIKKILRINKNANIKFRDLNRRIKKFVNRGWKSEINLTQIKHKQTRLKRITERETDGSGITECILPSGNIQIAINTSRMQIFKHCKSSNARILELFYNIFRRHNLSRALRNYRVGIFYDHHNSTIISVTGKNAEITTNFKKALLHPERKIDLVDIEEKGNGNFSKETILEIPTRQSKIVPETHNHYTLKWDTSTSNFFTVTTSSVELNEEQLKKINTSICMEKDQAIRWKKDGKRMEGPCLEMSKKDRHTLAEFREEEVASYTDLRSRKVATPLKTHSGGLIDKLIKCDSDLKIAKEEKARIEYGIYLTDNKTQHTHSTISLSQ